MKVIIIGYQGSQFLKKAGDYLRNKYLPDFDFEYINYTGEVKGWAEYIASYLKTEVNDELIIFALDDYLLANPIDMTEYNRLLKGMSNAVVAKLCKCTDQENEEYPVTTQYSIWNREYLIKLLSKIQTPWEFEIVGSSILKSDVKKAIFGSALEYYTNSALSSRWEGVRLDGLNEEDVKEIQKLI